MKDIYTINIGERPKGGKTMTTKVIWYKASLQSQIDKIDEVISVIKKDNKLYLESVDDDISGVKTESERAISSLETSKNKIYEIMDRVDENE